VTGLDIRIAVSGGHGSLGLEAVADGMHGLMASAVFPGVAQFSVKSESEQPWVVNRIPPMKPLRLFHLPRPRPRATECGTAAD
jgi:hypothetical protein